MDQKQLDDVEKKEGDNLKDNSRENEEKVNDVDGIMSNGDNPGASKTTSFKDTGSSSNTTTTNKNPEPDNSWNFDDDEDESKPGSTWKIISGILLILLVAAVYTNGFDFTGASTITGATTGTSTVLTKAVAEKAALDYINTNLLQAPFTATVKSSADTGTMYKVTVDVAGQTVDSYITKDGKLFFPQGFDTTKKLPTQEAPTNTGTTGAKKVDVSVDDDAMKGKKDAPVTIIEFSEYQCPFCKRFIDDAYPKIIKDYVDTGKVKYVFRDFPLGFHDQAKPAAMAAECAGDQGKYWEYHDLLFKNQASLSAANYKKWAKDLKLDTTKFDACVDTNKHKAEVEKDFADGQKAGVSGTPAFFINGKMISGAQPYSVFKAEIEAALKAAASGTATTGTTETKGTTGTTTTKPAAATKEFKVVAKKWRFDPNTLTVNKGDTVKVTLSSADIDFKFVSSDFLVDKEVKKGASETVTFTASKAGTFEFKCGTYCEKYGTVQGGSLKGSLVVK